MVIFQKGPSESKMEQAISKRDQAIQKEDTSYIKKTQAA